MAEPSLKAVTLTHVRYQRGDPLGHFLAWISLIPVFISLGGFVCHFFFRRELQGMFFAVGLLISQVINELIKDFFQQARPETCALLEMCDSHGWPSSHSQYMFFFATYFTLLTYKGIGLSDTTNKWAVIFPPWVLALLTMYSRVYLGYHTVAQVFAGSALGVFLGAVWFWVVNSVLYPSFPMIEESWFGRLNYNISLISAPICVKPHSEVMDTGPLKAEPQSELRKLPWCSNPNCENFHGALRILLAQRDLSKSCSATFIHVRTHRIPAGPISLGMEETPKKLLILYATQTGNAVEAAERVGREAERRGSCPVHLLSVDQYDAGCLAQEEGSRTVVIFVVSTTGQGVTPDSMKGFWNFLLRRNLSGQWLQGLHYAVFGLGDSGYQKFNYVAKRLDRRLLQLGATPIVERGLGDEQHPSGYEAFLDPWMTSLWNMLNEIHPNYYFPNGPEFFISDDKVKEAQPKIRILYHEIDKLDSQFSATSDLNHQAALLHIERARKMSPGKFSSHDENKPDCFLKLVKNERLTKSSGSKDDKEVHHLEFEFVSPAIEYDVGDLLEVVPCQNPAAIDDFMLRCNVDPESFITVHPLDAENQLPGTCSIAAIKLKAFVELTMDVASASPRPYFFEVMHMFATDEHEKGILEHLVSPEGRTVLHKYIHKERMTVNDVLKKFPSVQIPFEWLVQVVPPLKPRAFSISSSPSAHPNQVHLTVTVASWRSPLGRNRAGLCSNWLAKLDAKQEVYVPVWFRKGSLPPPPPSLPLILIGPGTGCAPFRGFVEERAIQSLNSTRTAPVMFFLGCRNKDKDFLYKDFWLSHSENGGILSEAKGGGFYVAFSRDDQSHNKVYVQHRMREHSKRVYDLLRHGGAAIYVAGSATKMPADVLSTFEEIIAKESGLPQESAVRCLKDIQDAGKYHVEAWS
ncbi:hypothetical protein ACFX2I_009484 [Malus domestica]